MNNESLTWGLRILLIVVVLAACIMLAVRIPKLLFSDPVQSGEDTCRNDPDFYYKDPLQYPYGC